VASNGTKRPETARFGVVLGYRRPLAAGEKIHYFFLLPNHFNFLLRSKSPDHSCLTTNVRSSAIPSPRPGNCPEQCCLTLKVYGRADVRRRVSRLQETGSQLIPLRRAGRATIERQDGVEIGDGDGGVATEQRRATHRRATHPMRNCLRRRLRAGYVAAALRAPSSVTRFQQEGMQLAGATSQENSAENPNIHKNLEYSTGKWREIGRHSRLGPSGPPKAAGSIGVQGLG